MSRKRGTITVMPDLLEDFSAPTFRVATIGDDRLIVTAANPSLERLLGQAAGSLHGCDLAEVLPVQVEAAARKLLAAQSSSASTCRGVELPAGVMADLLLQVVRGSSGRLEVMGILFGAFQASCSRPASLPPELGGAALDALSDMIVRTDARQVVLACNRAFAASLGLEPGAIVGRSLVEILAPQELARRLTSLARLSPQFPQRIWELVDEAAPGARQIWTDIVVFGLDGGVVEYQSIGRELDDGQQPAPEGNDGAGRGRAARRTPEQELEATEAWARLAIEAGGLQIWEGDLLAGTISLHPRRAELPGFRNLPVRQRAVEAEERLHPDDRAGLREKLQAILEGRTERLESEHRILDDDGSYRWFTARGRMVERDPARGRLLLVGAASDVTARREAQARLEASCQNLRLALSVSDQIVWTLEPATGERRVEGGADYWLGWPMRQAVLPALLWRDRLHLDDRDRASELTDRISTADDGRVVEVEHRWAHAEGGYGWVLTRAMVVERDAAGRPTRILGTSTDITRRKAAEIALRENEQRLRLALEAGQLVVRERDPMARTAAQGSAATARSGPVLRTVASEAQMASMPAADGAATLDGLAGGRQSQDPAPLLQLRAAGVEGASRGLESWERISSREGAGGSAPATGLIIDIASRREGEQAFERRMAQMGLLALAAAGAGSWRWDFRRGRVICSELTYRLFGMSPDAFDDRIEAFERRMLPADRRTVKAAVHRALDTGAPYHAEFRVTAADGSVRWLEGRGEVLRDAAGNPVELVGITLDVTRRKVAEAEIRQSRDRLLQALAAGGQLAWETDLATLTYRIEAGTPTWLGWPVEDLPRSREGFLALVHPEDRAMLGADKRSPAPAAQERDGVTCRFQSADGSYRWVELRVVVLTRDAADRPTRLLVTTTDIDAQYRAELVLEETSRRLELALKVGGIAIWEEDLAAGTISLDATAAAWLGLSAGATTLPAAKHARLVAPEDRLRMAKAMEAVTSGLVDQLDDERRILRPDGGVRWIHCRGQVADRDREGRPVRLLGVWVDVTHRREAEAKHEAGEAQRRATPDSPLTELWAPDNDGRQMPQRAASEARFRQIAATLPQAFWLVELVPERGLAYASPAWERISGRWASTQPRDARLWLDSVHPADRPGVAASFLTWLTGEVGERWESEHRLLQPDNSVRWILDEGRLIRDEGGRVVQAAGISTDITERKQADAALRKREQWLRLALRAGRLQVWERDFARRSVRVTGAPHPGEALRAFDVDVAEDEALESVHPEDRPAWLGQLSALREGAADEVQQQLRSRRQDGGYNWIEIHGQVTARDAAGRALRAMGVQADITAAKEAELALQRARAEVEAALAAERNANLMLRSFVAMASHEIRTPLAIIDAAAEFVAAEAELTGDEALLTRARRIQNAVARLVRLVQRLLEGERASAGRSVFRPQPTDPAELLVECLADARLDFPTRDIRPIGSWPALPALAIDAGLLPVAVHTMVSNAVKFSDPGAPITLSLEAEAGRARFVVRDQGIGIPTAELESVGERFYRASNAANRPGTGLGLALAREIARLHGGEIELDSVQGEGTTVALWLPIPPPDKTSP